MATCEVPAFAGTTGFLVTVWGRVRNPPLRVNTVIPAPTGSHAQVTDTCLLTTGPNHPHHKAAKSATAPAADAATTNGGRGKPLPEAVTIKAARITIYLAAAAAVIGIAGAIAALSIAIAPVTARQDGPHHPGHRPRRSGRSRRYHLPGRKTNQPLQRGSSHAV